MSIPFDFVGPGSGLLCGTLFGYVLQRGGLGSGCRLTAQLRLQDWTVFNVMFTAIIVAATGLYVLELAGVLDSSMIYTPTTYVWATLLGGALVGAGMGVGGYCPGTSVVGACAGRIDGLFFFVGLVAGTVVFAGAYDQVEPVLSALPGPEAQTLPQLIGLPTWAVLLLLVGVAAGVGYWSRRHPPVGGGTAPTSGLVRGQPA
jgi:uncharacterized membrane protein YedE/YeeE